MVFGRSTGPPESPPMEVLAQPASMSAPAQRTIKRMRRLVCGIGPGENLPKALHIERVGHAKTDLHLTAHPALIDKRRRGGVANEPVIFDEDVAEGRDGAAPPGLFGRFPALWVGIGAGAFLGPLTRRQPRGLAGAGLLAIARQFLAGALDRLAAPIDPLCQRA